MKRGYRIIVAIILIIGICFLLLFDFKEEVNHDVSSINFTRNVVDNSLYTVDVSFKDNVDKSTRCLLTKDEKPNGDWVKIQEGKCSFNTPLGIYNLYLKDKFGNITKYEDKYKVDIILKDNNYYMYNGLIGKIDYEIMSVGGNASDLKFISNNSNIVNVNSNNIHAKSLGNTKIDILFKDEVVSSVNVYVTNSIRDMHSTSSKEYIKCGQFSLEEAKLVDNILFKRVKDAGEGTRAGVLAATRFITLEFNYRVHYFFENGRLMNYEPYLFVDGEGRYYHKGLYLHSSKFEDIQASFVGPAIWGCDLKNFTTLGSYQQGLLYPNGLDCSGFVSWALYNGGMEIGDIGAGFEDGHFDYTDLGVRKNITNDLIYSGEVKAGDLIGNNGHIAIIAGIDDNNYYIAESLDTTGGVVITTVSKDKLTSSIYKHIILMDGVYNGDGNYSVMW